MTPHPTDAKLKPLLPPEMIEERVRLLGMQISHDFAGKMGRDELPLVLLGVLKGSFIFLADLARELMIPVEIEFATMSSYGNKMVSSGTVELQLSPPIDLADRRVLVVEDIADTGRSLSKLLSHLQSLNAKEVRVCALLNKPDARVVDVQVDYIGFDIPAKYIVGYGLDAAQHFRQLAGIYELEE